MERPLAPDDAALLPELEELLSLVARAGHHDLRDYRRPTLARRVMARMTSVGAADLTAYRALLERDPGEVEALARALLVHVTSFFREPAVFEALERQVVPALLAEGPPPAMESERLRAWVVGAATGEEAYSLAVALAGACGARGADWDVLATDREPRMLEAARAGAYALEALDGLPPACRAALFEVEGSVARVTAPLRRRVRFAAHDLLGPQLAPEAAVLADFHLVLCRNVLLYLDPRAQALALERLGAVLRGGGALVLGHAEALPRTAEPRFEAFPGVDPGLRIYVKRPPR